MKQLLQDRWKNRRAMAWISLIAALLFPMLLLYTESDQLGSVAGAFYLFVGAVVGSYMGFATLDDKWQGIGSNNNSNINKALESEGFPPEPK